MYKIVLKIMLQKTLSQKHKKILNNYHLPIITPDNLSYIITNFVWSTPPSRSG